MELLREIAEVFAASGGFGLAAYFAWLYRQKDQELAALQAEIRGDLGATTTSLVSAITEHNLITKQQVDMLQRVLDRIPHSRERT